MRTFRSPERIVAGPRPCSRRAVLAFLLLVVACRGVDPFDEATTGATPTRGAVVAANPLAVAAGLSVLEAGGNAADAAVATALALAVVYPQAGNLGGGGFALWVPHEGVPTSLDFRETTPAGYRAQLYLDADGQVVAERSLTTPLAVGVPGSPSGLFDLQQKHGELDFEDVVRPAIVLARGGFRVDPWLALALRDPEPRARLEKDPAARELFYPGGEPLQEGTRLRQPDLARTLELYARDGPSAILEGDVAKSIIVALAAADMRSGGVTRGGMMSLDDLSGYQVVEREPVIGWFRGSEVIGMGPPSSGGIALLQVLSILDGFPLDADRAATLQAIDIGVGGSAAEAGMSARALHWWIEAMRRAFADRATHLGDPDFWDVPTAGLLAPSYVAGCRVSIGERADLEVAAMGTAAPEEGGETTHLSVVDDEGNAVSLTTTLNATFGSGILVPDVGFLLNNELDDFSIVSGTPNLYGLTGSEANQLRPRKRPLSSMTPTIVRDGGTRVSIVIGAPGGPRIITSVIQVLLRLMVYEQELEAAVRAPRLHQQWKPDATKFEPGWSADLLEALQNRHAQPIEVVPDGRFGCVQAIVVLSDGEPVGFSDPRRGGVAGLQGRQLPRPATPDGFRR